MRLIFVRHGEPDYAKDCVTEKGAKQAEYAAERLKDEGIEKIFSSTMGRAMQTAEPLAKLLGLPVNTFDYMREVKWGSIDGTPLFAGGHPWDIADEYARQGRDLTDPNWRQDPLFANNIVTAQVDMIGEKTDEWLLSLGYERCGLYYRCVREDNDQHTVVMFSHGGSSAAAMGHILNLPFPYACALFHLEFTGITVIRLNRNPGAISLPCLELANDSRHIKGESYHRLKDM